MSQISLKSLSGITSITTPEGVDNQLTIHTNDTTEKLKVTSDGVNVTGVVTATSFSGSGANLTGIDATAIQTGNTKIQTSATLISNQISGSGIATVQAGGLDVTGVVTATSFVGSGVNLTGVSGTEVYGFTGIGSNLQVTTTNRGADNITGAQYDAFEQVLFAPSGITFSINNSGNLIASF